MKITVEQITPERAEEVLLRCHNPKEPWVEEIQGIAAGQITVNGMADGKLCRLKLGDIYYFEVVDGNAFFYCQKEVFSSKQKLYEFEALCVGTMLFRCSKSMILNAGKIDYVLPSLSGRFEAVLDNGEKVIIYGSSIERTDPKAQAGGDPERRVEQWIKWIGYAAQSAAAKHAP